MHNKGQEKMGSGSKHHIRFPYRDFFPPITLETFEDRSDVSPKVLKSKLYAFAEAIGWHFSTYY